MSAHGQRGQAITETVVFLPLFLIALFGIIWATRTAVQYERTQLAVRYSGLISQEINPYTQYSLFAMYSQLGSATMPTVTCVAPLTTLLNDGAPYASTQTSTLSQPFWNPAGPTSSCASAGVIGIPAGSTFAQDVVVLHQKPTIVSRIDVPGIFASTIGPYNTMEADQNFFKPIGEDVILACFPTLNATIGASLAPPAAPLIVLPPVPLGNVYPTPAVAANNACTIGGS